MHTSMETYPRSPAERAMKLQGVLLRATSGKIKWWQAAKSKYGLSLSTCTSANYAGFALSHRLYYG